jgi:membrane fusion protein (multidrug efflux system)
MDPSQPQGAPPSDTTKPAAPLSEAAPVAAPVTVSAPVPGAAHHVADHHVRRGTLLVWGIATAVIVTFIVIVLRLIYAPKPIVETEDARVAVHYASIAPRVAAPIVAVKVTDNQTVHAGDPLVQLDPRDYEVAVANARAILERDRSRIFDISASLQRQPSLINEAQAKIPGIEARITFAEQNLTRYRNLADTGAGTAQSHQMAVSDLKQAQSDLEAANASVQASKRQIDVFKAEQNSAGEQVKVDAKNLEQAQLNLEYTTVRAPMDGTVGQLSVQLGDYANAGSPLMGLVPLNDVYIEANYLESELRHVLPGQPVKIHLDAYNLDINGVVDGIAPASGATFSVIPPENATGNFTKIVQRLSVKIRVLPNQPVAKLLRVGMNVETAIDTHLTDVVAAQQRAGAQAAPVTNR